MANPVKAFKSKREQKTGRKTTSVAVADRRAAENYTKKYEAKAKPPTKSTKTNKTVAKAQGYHQTKGSAKASRSSHARTRGMK